MVYSSGRMVARPVMAQQNMAASATSGALLLFSFQKTCKTSPKSNLFRSFIALVAFIVVRITREEPLTERCAE